MSLTGPTRAAASGNTRSLVVFLHGYGADGNDLLALAEPLAAELPDTAFAAPDAPQRCTGNPFGYQWFPIPWLDGSSEAEAAAGLAESASELHAFLDALPGQTGIDAEATAIVGFSQGTMMALEVLPRRPQPVAGLVGFSGRLLGAERLKAETVSRPPVLLIHGEADDVVPPVSMPEAETALRDAGFEVATHLSRGTPHAIAPDGLSLALGFLREKLGA